MRKKANEYIDTLSNVKKMTEGVFIGKSKHAYTIVKVYNETSYEVRHVNSELLSFIHEYENQ